MLLCFLPLLSGIFKFNLVPPVQAAILWQDGFESGSLSAWDGHAGTVDVSSSHVFTGTYSANQTAVLGSWNHYVYKGQPGLTELHFSCHYYIDTLTFPAESYPDIPRIGIMDIQTNGPMGVELNIEKNGASYYWRVRYIDSLNSGLISVCPPAAGSWYGLELEWNTTGGMTGTTFWVNGTRVWSDISADGMSSLSDSVDLGSFSYWGSNAFTFKSYFDDAVLGDAYLGCPGVGAPTPDTSPPEFLDGNPYLETNTLAWTSNVARENCSVSCNVTDNVGVSGYFAGYSLDSVSWTNSTWKAASGSNVLANASFIVPYAPNITSSLYVRLYANDTSNNWGYSRNTWPADYLSFPLCNATTLSTYWAYNDVNSPGSRRIFRSPTHWVAIYADYTIGRIYASTSRDGISWGHETELNNMRTLGTDESSCWSAYVWGNQIYYFYYNGSYSVVANSTYAWLGRASIDSVTGAISYMGGEACLVSAGGGCLLDPAMALDWPGAPPPDHLVYGYYTFSWGLSKDATRLNWAVRLTGAFASGYSRIYCGWWTNTGSLVVLPASRNPGDTDYVSHPICVQTDPSHDKGFVLLFDRYNDWVYYTRWTGTAWQPVNGRTTDVAEPLVSSTDWTTTYYSSIGRLYFTAGNLDATDYFPDDATNNAAFINGGPNLAGYVNPMLGHTSESCYILARIGQTYYKWIKTGPTVPPAVEAATWTGPTLVVREKGSVTKLSTTDNPGPDDKLGMLWGNTTGSYTVTFYAFGSARMIISINSLDLEGCGNWVFVNWRYYNWSVAVWHAVNASEINLAQLRFFVNTAQGPVINTISCDLINWTLAFSPENITDYNIFPVRIIGGNVSYSADWTTVYFSFRIYFTDRCLDEYLNGFDLQARATDSEGYDTGFLTIASRAFLIYNKGGFSINAMSGAAYPGAWAGAGVNTAITPFSFFAGNNSYATDDLYYRDLVHIKFCPDIEAIVGRQTFYLTYGFDYCVQGVDWVTGWKVILGAHDVTLGTERYWNWTVSWFNQGNFIRQDTLITYQRTGLGRPEITDAVSQCHLWIDFWFDAANGSTVGGGRVGAYEWAMKNSVPAWLAWLTSSWGPMEDQPTASEYMTPLLEPDNTTIVSAARIKMVRVWSRIEVASDTLTQWAYALDYPVWDLTFSQTPGTITGIQTPAFDPPAMPDQPGGGMLGALFSGFSYMLKYLADSVLYGGLSLWPTFVAFLDTIAGWLNMPNGFSNFLSWLGTSSSGLFSGLTWLGSALAGGVVFLAIFMSQLLAFIALIFTYLGQVIAGVFGFFTGTIGGAGDVWTSLNLTQWVILGIIVYPIYLILMWDEDGLDAVETELRRDWWVLSTIFGVLVTIGRYIVQILTALIESIPVVE
jgi:hypothetical protein